MLGGLIDVESVTNFAVVPYGEHQRTYIVMRVDDDVSNQRDFANLRQPLL